MTGSGLVGFSPTHKARSWLRAAKVNPEVLLEPWAWHCQVGVLLELGPLSKPPGLERQFLLKTGWDLESRLKTQLGHPPGRGHLAA